MFVVGVALGQRVIQTWIQRCVCHIECRCDCRDLLWPCRFIGMHFPSGERFRGLSDGRNAIRIASIYGLAALAMTFVLAPRVK